MRKLVIAIVLLLFAGEAWSACTGCSGSSASIDANCTAAQVNTCIGAVSNGATITVGAGSGTWGSTININKPITLRGGGPDVTTITLSPAGWDGAIQIQAHASSNTRLTGFTLTGPGYLVGITGAYNNTSYVRLDSIEFANNDMDYGNIEWRDNQPGLIDNCTFSPSGASETIHVRGNNDDDASWARASNLGTGGMLIVENNTFTGGSGNMSALTSFDGSRWTVRYNQFTQVIIDTHPKGLWSHNNGGRLWEIYNNSWDSTLYSLGDLKAGTGVIHHNASDHSNSIQFHLPNLYLTDGYPCCCISNLNGSGCTQRPGFGEGQALEPAYVWGNFTNFDLDYGADDYGNACDSTCGGHQAQSNAIRLNTEYYASAKSGYTTFTCPHPLTGLSGTCDPDIAGRSGYNVEAGAPSVPVLTSPIGGATTGYPVQYDWEDVEGATKYEIQVCPTSDCSSPVIDVVIDCGGVCDATDSEYEAPAGKLAPNTRYYWRVRAMTPN